MPCEAMGAKEVIWLKDGVPLLVASRRDRVSVANDNTLTIEGKLNFIAL